MSLSGMLVLLRASYTGAEQGHREHWRTSLSGCARAGGGGGVVWCTRAGEAGVWGGAKVSRVFVRRIVKGVFKLLVLCLQGIPTMLQSGCVSVVDRVRTQQFNTLVGGAAMSACIHPCDMQWLNVKLLAVLCRHVPRARRATHVWWTRRM